MTIVWIQVITISVDVAQDVLWSRIQKRLKKEPWREKYHEVWSDTMYQKEQQCLVEANISFFLCRVKCLGWSKAKLSTMVSDGIVWVPLFMANLGHPTARPRTGWHCTRRTPARKRRNAQGTATAEAMAKAMGTCCAPELGQGDEYWCLVMNADADVC